MTVPADASTSAETATTRAWPAVLTWRAHAAPRMESVRIQLIGNRIKAAGRIIGGECAEHPAFSASYDLVTDDNGITRRLSLHTTLASGEKQLSLSRDGEGYWLVHDGQKLARSEFGGALDVDVMLSPMFNALPIRRNDLHTMATKLHFPVVYVSLPNLSVREAELTYDSGPEGIRVISPVASATVRVDANGFILDYPGLAERI